MPFDIDDSRIREIIGEDEDIEIEEVKDVERNQRNYITFIDGKSFNTLLGISMREKSFDRGEFERVVDTSITELS